MAGLISARPSGPRPYCRGLTMLAAVLGLLAFGGLIASAPAAQELQFPQRPPPPKKSKIALEREKSGQKQMLVQANEINYDYANNRVAAVGNVQIYYGGLDSRSRTGSSTIRRPNGCTPKAMSGSLRRTAKSPTARSWTCRTITATDLSTRCA